MPRNPKIGLQPVKAGVLALQGAFREHREALDALGTEAVEVRTPEDLDGVEALLLPGGESTTMTKLVDSSGLRAPIAERIGAGMPVFATCAGLILLAGTCSTAAPTRSHSACST